MSESNISLLVVSDCVIKHSLMCRPCAPSAVLLFVLIQRGKTTKAVDSLILRFVMGDYCLHFSVILFKSIMIKFFKVHSHTCFTPLYIQFDSLSECFEPHTACYKVNVIIKIHSRSVTSIS